MLVSFLIAYNLFIATDLNKQVGGPVVALDATLNQQAGIQLAMTAASVMTGALGGPQAALVKSGKKKSGGIDFDALRRHGYKGGLSIMNVPALNHERTGSEAGTKKDAEESYRERQKLRDIVAHVELQVADVVARKKASASFAHKEKRKSDLGQTSRGKNYVEEEKRLLRDNGVYSGFDSGMHQTLSFLCR